MILIISSKTENYSSQIETLFCSENIQYYRFNLDIDSIKNTFITYDNKNIQIIQNGNAILLSSIKFVLLKIRSIYFTPEEKKDFCGFSDELNFELWKDEWNSCVRQIMLFLEQNNVKWFGFDSPRILTQAESKINQIYTAKKIGFNVPKTIISNDKNKIINFMNEKREYIVKLSTQPAFYINDNIYFVYTNKISVDDLSNFDEYVNSPVIYQEYIEKQYEIRYTFVNGKHFVCRIDSQFSEKSKIDWRRYDIKNTPYREITPPNETRKKVEQFMLSMKLTYGALDFIVDKAEKWWFLEINPLGQYGWIEQLTDMPITQAIVDFIKSKM